jgi:hypothetical protein
MSVSLKKIRLELARDHAFPEGSRRHGYEIVAPLSEIGRIDVAAWRKARERCTVRRFWGDKDEENGHLIRRPGGTWAFHYDLLGDADDDETGYRFGDHSFQPGEYVSIKEHDDVLRTFRVVAVRDF